MGHHIGSRRVRRTIVAFLISLTAAAGLTVTHPAAQAPQVGLVAGRNVNMVSGTKWPTGDPYLQRQNEPSVATSTRNPLHLLGGSNDYRTVDLPFVDGAAETGDAWMGLFKSFDGGQRWRSTLLPGYPQDTSPEGLASPLKTYQAGADPVVRAGTNGLFYFSGLAFNRGDNGKSTVFVARFIDNNNREGGDPIAYLGTSLVASATGVDGRFFDKPWLAVDMPRLLAPTCTIVTPGEHGPITQKIKAGTAYVAFSSITGDGPTLRSEIFFTRSTNCGKTWSTPVRISRPTDAINQGASIAIDPITGAVYIAWRRFSVQGTEDGDAIMVTRSLTFGLSFSTPDCVRRLVRGSPLGLLLESFLEHRRARRPVQAAELSEFDQGTSASAIAFRTNAYPTMTFDDQGRIYVAWVERGFAAARPDPFDGDARVVISTSRFGFLWTAPRAVEDTPEPGHQLMPTLSFAGGKLVVVYYDLKEDRSQVFGKFIDDQSAIVAAQRRHTFDIRAAMGSPGTAPVFEPSVRVSDYLMGFQTSTSTLEQLQVNPPNLPMFAQGTVPFMGDYIDVAPAPPFVPLSGGRWGYNTSGPVVFHAVWTDNRDVQKPPDLNGDGKPDWDRYTPPTQRTGASLFDPSKPLEPCVPGFAASRNQNIYTARLTRGLLAGSPGNAKPLSSSLQRAFVVFAQNATAVTKVFRLTILNQPAGGRASFEQFPLPPYNAGSPPPRLSIDVTTPPRSMAARTVYVTSTNPHASVSVDVSEIAFVGAPGELPGGLGDVVVLNPDVENPDVENPGLTNPDIENTEVYTPDIENPDVENPDVENPDVENPDVENPDVENPDVENADLPNPDIENVVVATPDIENPDVENPDVENPDVENPDVENPDVENPDVENGALADVTWQVTNTGNTTSAFNVNLFLAQHTTKLCPPGVDGQQPGVGCINVQLILRKTYTTPTTTGCTLQVQTHNVLVANIPNPQFITPSTPDLPDQNDPSANNATLWLGPGEIGQITLRLIDPNTSDNVTVLNDKGEAVSIDPDFLPTGDTAEDVTPIISSQNVNSNAPPGTTEPPIVTPSASSIFFLQQPSTTVFGSPVAPAVSVQVRDQSGAVLPNVAVAITLGANPTGATLAGGGPVMTDLSGIALFPALVLDRPGVGFTLVASVSGLTPVTSSPFDVPFVVTNTADAGAGSLRNALLGANATAAAETIAFAIPGAAPFTITLQSELPTVTSPAVIDAATQSGYEGAPVVEINGSDAVAGYGLQIWASGTTVRGLAITSFPQDGIFALQGLTGIVIEDNYIGVSPGGFPNGNVSHGVRLRSSNSQVRRNVISNNGNNGILVEGSSGNTLADNRIGTDPGGAVAAPNLWSGITMYDGSANTVIQHNLIAANTQWGIDLQQSGVLAQVTGTQILDNTIGLDVAGASLGNGTGGVRVNLAPGTQIGTPGHGNVIAGNVGDGILITGDVTPGVQVQGNRVGTDPTGTAARANTGSGISLEAAAGTTIGGAAGNVVSGNAVYGIALTGGSHHNTIQGNLIGTNAAGNAALGNVYDGVTIYSGAAEVPSGHDNLIGGDTPQARNVISANAWGVVINDPLSTGNRVVGNYIGTDITGVLPLGNAQAGVQIADGASNNWVGGTLAGEGNLIAFNGGAGVLMWDLAEFGFPMQNRILGNSIDGNGTLGIDLGNDGVTFNDEVGDGDAGPNGQQNFPELTQAVNNIVSEKTELSFVFSGAASTIFRLEVFAGPACDPSGYGEGRQFLTAVNIETSGDGLAAGTVMLPDLLPMGTALTATATDPAGNTSEFSNCLQLFEGVFQWKVADGGNDHYYEYVRAPGSWTSAAQAAPGRVFKSKPGHLVTIASAGENAFVQSLKWTGDLRGWIGLTDTATEGVFQWITDEPFVYANWNGGEPNDSGGIEDYTEIFGSGAWNDTNNFEGFNQGFVVEYPVGVGEITDPAGDATPSPVVPSPDMVWASVSKSGADLVLKVRFAPGTFDPATTLAQFLLDTDENAATGHPGVNSGCLTDAGVIGSEFLVNLFNGSSTIYQYAGSCNSFSFAGTASVTNVTDGMDVTVPLSVLGGDDGLLHFKLTVSAYLGLGYTGVLDVMTDVGLAPGKTGGI